MREVTHAVRRYRECARNLWNVYFLELVAPEREWDLSDEFEEICTQLFSALVLHPLGELDRKKARGYEATPDPLDILRVVQPLMTEHGIFVNREVPRGGYWDYPVDYEKAAGADFRFIDFFDFDRLGFRDLRYYHVRIVACSADPLMVGRDALVSVESAEVLYDGAQGEADGVRS